MSNEVVDYHRKKFPGDTRSDKEITAAYYTGLGQGWMEQNAEKVPQFYRDYRSIYYGNENELTKGISRGYEGLKSTAMGGVGLALDAVPGEIGFVEDLKKGALEKATEIGARASGPSLAPRERAFKNVDSLGGALEYTGALVGESVPSLAESVVVGAVGALAGSTVAPGPGTAAGAIGGFVSKQAAKKLIQKAVKKELGELSEKQVKDALAKKGSKEIIKKVDDLVRKQAKSYTAQRGALTANALNSYGLSSGEIYNELANDPNVDPDDAFNTSITFGAIAAAPDVILPSVVLNKMGVFDKIAGLKKAAGKKSSKADRNAFKSYLLRFLPEVSKNASIEGATEGFQEYVNISAGKFARGEGIDSPFNLTEEEYGRIQRAGAMGIAGGFTVSPLSAINVREEARDFTTKDEGDEVVGTDEEGRPIREVSPKKKLSIPAPTADPLTAEEEAEASEVALLYLQGQLGINEEAALDADLQSRVAALKRDPRTSKRFAELVLDFRRQIQVDALKRDAEKAPAKDDPEEAKRLGIEDYDQYQKRLSYVATLAKVLNREPLTEQEVALIEERGGTTVQFEEGGEKFGVVPEEAIEDESELEFPVVLYQGQQQPQETPTETQPVEQKAEPIIEDETSASQLSEMQLVKKGRYFYPPNPDTGQADTENYFPVYEVEINGEKRYVTSFEDSDTGGKVWYEYKGTGNVYPYFVDTGFGGSLYTEEEGDPVVYERSKSKIIDTLKGVPAANETSTTQDESGIIDVEPVGEEKSEVAEPEFDYGSTVNPFIQTVKQAPAPKPAEANKFTNAAIEDKQNVSDGIGKAINELVALNEQLQAKYEKPGLSEQERQSIMFSMKATQDRLDGLTRKVALTNKRIETLKEQLVPEDQFIDADTGQEITSSSLTEESLDYEATVPTRVETTPDADATSSLIADINEAANKREETRDAVINQSGIGAYLDLLRKSQEDETVADDANDSAQGVIEFLRSRFSLSDDQIIQFLGDLSAADAKGEQAGAAINDTINGLIDTLTGSERVIRDAQGMLEELGFTANFNTKTKLFEAAPIGLDKSVQQAFKDADARLKGGKPAPAYYEIDPTQVENFDQALEELGKVGQETNNLDKPPALSDQSQVEKGQQNDVRRLTAFYNKETGEVFVLGTGKAVRGKSKGQVVVFVDRGKGKVGSLSLSDIKEQGDLIPFASMRLVTPRSKPTFYYGSLEQFKQTFGNATSRTASAITAQNSAVQAVEESVGDIDTAYTPDEVADKKERLEEVQNLNALLSREDIADELWEHLNGDNDMQEDTKETLALAYLARLLAQGKLSEFLSEGSRRYESYGLSGESFNLDDDPDGVQTAALDLLAEEIDPMFGEVETRDEFKQEIKGFFPDSAREVRQGTDVQAITEGSGENQPNDSSVKEGISRIKQSPAEAVDPTRPSDAQIKQRFVAALQSLAAAGVDIQVLTNGLSQQMGMYVDQAIQLVISDLANPTTDTIRLLLHEGGHSLFDNLPAGLQEAFHRSIENLTDDELQVNTEKLSSKIAADNPINETVQEERLVDSVARELAESGFDPSEAKSLVQQILDFLRGLYLRSYIEVQKALRGPEFINGDMARDYFKLRLESYLTANYSPNAITMMGGAPLTAEQLGQLKRGDQSNVTMVYDFNSGIVELKEIPSETVEDVLWNSRRKVKFLSDGTREEIEIDPKPELSRLVAVEKYMAELYSDMYASFNESGLNIEGITIEDFIKDILRVKNPQEILQGLVEAGGDPESNLDGLEGTTARPRAAKQIYTRMRRLRRGMEINRGRASSAAATSLIKKASKKADALKNLQKNYTDITTYSKGIASVIDQALKEYAAATKSSRPHLVVRVLKKLDPNYKYKDYKTALESARKKVLGMDDLLAAIGTMDLDFASTDPEQLAIEIRDRLDSTTVSDKVKDNALIASIIGFGKRYPEAMTLLQLRGEKNRANVDRAISLMLSDNEAGLTEARRLLKETIINTRKGERLHQQILRVKSDLKKHLDSHERLQKRADAADTAERVLTQREQEVSSLFGGERAVTPKTGGVGQWEPIHGTNVYVPTGPDDTIETLVKSRKEILISSEQDYGLITQIIQKQGEWLVANGESGEFNALIKRQRDHLMELQADFTQYQVQQNFVTRLVGDVAAKMEGTGGPKGRQIARRIRKFVSFMQTYGGSRTTTKGVAWANAENQAMKAVESSIKKHTQKDFRRRFYDPFFAFAAENINIIEMYPGDIAAAEREVIRRAKSYMSERTKGDSDKVWDELTKLYKLSASRNGYIDQMRDKMGVKVLDEIKVGKETIKFFRDTIGSPMFSLMRRTSEGLEMLYNDMIQSWNGAKAGYLNLKVLTEAFENDNILEVLGDRFSDQVMNEFVEPLINKPTSPFYRKDSEGGENYSQAAVLTAWESTKGLEGSERIIAFATELSETSVDGSTPESAAQIVNTFNTYFRRLETMYGQREENQSSNPVPVHTMMDARVAQDFPAEWLEFSTYSEREMRYYAESLSYEAAYGRDLVGIKSDFDALEKELRGFASKYEDFKRQAREEVEEDLSIADKDKPKEIRKRLKKKANEKIGFRVLKEAEKNLATLRSERRNFDTILENKREQVEYGAFIELVSALTGATVQGFSTAITDMSTAIEGPFRKFGLSSYGMSSLFKNVKYTAIEALGTLLQALPVNVNVNADRVRRRTRLGLVDDDALVSFRERYVSNMQDEFRSKGMVGKGMEVVSRGISTLLTTGIGKAKDKDQLYTTLKAAPFSMFVNWQTAGVTDSVFDVFTDFVGRAGEFFAANPDKISDPSYQIKAKDLGMNDKLFGLIQNERAFDYIVNTFQQHGLNATELGKQWVLNGKKNPLTDEHYRRIAAVTATEFMLENTKITQPSAMEANKLLLLARPLLRWGVAKTGDLAKALPKIIDRENLDLKDPDTIKALKAYRNFAMGMGMAVIPLSLAWAMVRDEYDEELLGKRGNLMRFGEANPFLVLMDRLDRVGTFGMAGELANTTLNMNNAREFGVDNRVFFVNSILSLSKAVGTYYRQGSATYATVGRPALMALGFGGGLQNFQLASNLLGADNFESRYAARVNVNNILRSAGKELSLDVRNFSGGGAMPTPMKPYIAEMVLSSYANDPTSFRTAYRDALKAAEAMGKEDPEKSVKSSLTMYHPLRYIFRTPPLESEFNKILGAAGDGRQAINESIQLFNKYAETIGVKPYMGKKAKSSSATDPFKPIRMEGLSVPRLDYRSFSVDSSGGLPF